MSCKYKRIDCAQFVCPVAAQKLSCHVLTLNGDSNPSSFCPNKTLRNLDIECTTILLFEICCLIRVSSLL